jgi:hypothetical protein
MSELSSEARRLIAAMADADGPPRDRQAQVKQQLFLRMSAVAAGAVIAKSAFAAPSSALSLPVAAKATVTLGTLATAAAIGGMVGLGVVIPAAITTSKPASSAAIRSPSQSTRPHLAAKTTYPMPSASALASAAPRASEPTSFVEVAAPREEPAQRSAVSSTIARTAALPDAHETSAAADTRLAEEVALLNAARRELAGGHGAQALALVERHARRFPDGALRQERTAAKVLALCELGRVESAAALARALLAAAPESPLRQRLEQSCAFTLNQRKSSGQ